MPHNTAGSPVRVPWAAPVPPRGQRSWSASTGPGSALGVAVVRWPATIRSDASSFRRHPDPVGCGELDRASAQSWLAGLWGPGAMDPLLDGAQVHDGTGQARTPVEPFSAQEPPSDGLAWTPVRDPIRLPAGRSGQATAPWRDSGPLARVCAAGSASRAQTDLRPCDEAGPDSRESAGEAPEPPPEAWIKPKLPSSNSER